MARYTSTFTADKGRDKGKKFLLTEMSPRAAHLWATRMLLGMAAGGLEIDGIEDKGLAGLATMAMTAIAKIPEMTAIPLLNQLLDCVQSVQERATRELFEDDIEEVATLFLLQKAVLELHINPFISGDPLTSESAKEPGQTA